jgi:hypothetical protein
MTEASTANTTVNAADTMVFVVMGLVLILKPIEA